MLNERPLFDSLARTPGHQAGNHTTAKSLIYRRLQVIVNAGLLPLGNPLPKPETLNARELPRIKTKTPLNFRDAGYQC
jgi:hypothetical protein